MSTFRYLSFSMPSEQHITLEKEDRHFLSCRMMRLHEIAEGDSEDPINEARGILGELRTSPLLLEACNAYRKHFYETLLDGLQDIQQLLRMECSYDEDVQWKIFDALQRASQRARSKICEVECLQEYMKTTETHIEERLAIVRKERVDHAKQQLEIALLLDEGEIREDLTLCALIELLDLHHDLFDSGRSTDALRAVLTSMLTKPKPNYLFQSPQHLACAFQRRGWMSQQQLEELLEGWE
jgi:hypothetical protein